ncbi:MAG: S-layer homology domain-containing protein [Patescibacteria group bacterium]
MSLRTTIILSFAVITIFTTSLTFAESSAFPDVAANNPNKIAIDYLQENGVINGYGDGTFKPQNRINRAELIKVLVEGQGITPDANEYSHCFPDVGNEWFAPYVCYAKEVGWVSGYPDGTFQPARIVSKVESLKMILNVYGFTVPEQVSVVPFADTEEDAWYTPFVSVAKDRGLLEETGSNFEPAGAMARGGVAENIFRSIAVKNVNVETFSPSIIETAINMPIVHVEHVDTLITGNTYIDSSTHITNVINPVLDNSNNTTTDSQPSSSNTINQPSSPRNCTIENGAGRQTWNGSSWSSCVLTSCNAIYHVENDACVPNVRSCDVEYGTGEQTWNTATRLWSACTIKSCDDGYKEKDGICKKNLYVSQPTVGLSSSSPSGSRSVTASDGIFIFSVSANNGKVLLESLTVNLSSDGSFNLEQGNGLTVYLKEGGSTIATSSITLTNSSSGSVTFTLSPAFEIAKDTNRTLILQADTMKLIVDQAGTDDMLTPSISLGAENNPGGFIWSDGITNGISWGVDVSSYPYDKTTLSGITLKY